MNRPHSMLIAGLVAAGLGAGALSGCAPAEPPCDEQVASAEAAVHTERNWSDAETPGIGDYLEVHWQVRVLGIECSRAPGPNDFEYQAVLRLRPEDAAAAVDWPLAEGPPPVWPALAPFVPAPVTWHRSPTTPDLYVDPGTSTALLHQSTS